ncbi:hypothetical protein GCM10020001_003390 [Nonomuraea salmonea]
MLDERGDEPDRPEHVRRHDGLGGGEERLGLAPVLDPHDAGHRDQHVQAGVPGEDLLRGGLDAGGVGGVDGDGVHAGVLGGDPLQQFGTPPAHDHGVALVAQGEGEREPDAARRTGDEDGVP